MNDIINFLNPLYEATDKELCKKMGELLQKERKMQGLTQQELAGRSGVSRTQIAKIEATGKTTLLSFIALTRALRGLDKLFDAYEVPELKPSEIYQLEEKKRKIIKNRKKYN